MRTKRLNSNLLQKDIAKNFGANPATIHLWETNQKQPSVTFIPKIIEFLGYVPEGILSEKTLGEKIIYQRQLLGLSQKKLAHLLGVDPSTLGRWKRDARKPSKKYLENINNFQSLLT